MMCKAYLSGIENQTLGVFDPWFFNAEASVTALGSFIDEVLAPNVNPGGCPTPLGTPPPSCSPLYHWLTFRCHFPFCFRWLTFRCHSLFH